MTRREKRFLAFSVVMGGVLFVPQSAYAMHIMEGYLPPAYCAAWGALCLPFLAAGVVRLRRTVQAQRKALLLLAMSGAFIFVISSLKIPSVTGSCSHMTGTGLAAILFGPAYAAVLGLIVLVFQAVLLAHGGLTTLGANVFSMAIAGPWAGYGVWRLLKAAKAPTWLGVFSAMAVANLFTYCVTSLQLALAYPDATTGFLGAVAKFLGVFAVTQIPLSIAEGVLGVLLFGFFTRVAPAELARLGVITKEAAHV